MMFLSDTGWQSINCTDCGSKVLPDQVQRPFRDARLCPSCVDDLFLTSVPVHQQPKAR
jgi:NAD-dependent SIR2 family protein deacetylase